LSSVGRKTVGRGVEGVVMVYFLQSAWMPLS